MCPHFDHMVINGIPFPIHFNFAESENCLINTPFCHLFEACIFNYLVSFKYFMLFCHNRLNKRCSFVAYIHKRKRSFHFRPILRLRLGRCVVRWTNLGMDIGHLGQWSLAPRNVEIKAATVLSLDNLTNFQFPGGGGGGGKTRLRISPPNSF